MVPVTDRTKVSVATDELRAYAKQLRTHAVTVKSSRVSVYRGGVTLDDWGVYDFVAVHKAPTVDEEGGMKQYPLPAPDELVAFKNAYEAAHEAAITRLKELERKYRDTATALDELADSYDRTEGVNSGGESHGR